MTDMDDRMIAQRLEALKNGGRPPGAPATPPMVAFKTGNAQLPPLPLVVPADPQTGQAVSLISLVEAVRDLSAKMDEMLTLLRPQVPEEH